MDGLNIFTNLGGANPETLRWMIPTAVALFFFCAVLALTYFGSSLISPVRRRLATISGNQGVAVATSARIANKLSGLAPVILPSDPRESTSIRLKLTRAGLRAPQAVILFYGIKALCAITVPALSLYIMRFFPELSTNEMVMLGAAGTMLGLFGPNAMLDRLIAERQLMVRRGFPDALDLLVVCIEAGLSFDLAFRRISDEMRIVHPALADELSIINAEIRAGVERVRALKNFADRVGLDDIHGFVALLAQSMRFGTSIADTLRIYADDFRDKRLQLAEEKAAKVGTKMIFPLVMCFFPCFFIVAVGPAIVKMLNAFAM